MLAPRMNATTPGPESVPEYNPLRLAVEAIGELLENARIVLCWHEWLPFYDAKGGARFYRSFGTFGLTFFLPPLDEAAPCFGNNFRILAGVPA